MGDVEEVDNAASVKGAAWSMSVDLGMSQGEGKTKGSKKLKDEALKQELRGKVEKSLLKLHDRDTVQNALAEIIAMAEDMKTEHGQALVAALIKFEDPKNAFARSNLARLFPAVAQANYGLVQAHMSKMVSSLSKRIKDQDTGVRDAVAESIGGLASLVCSKEVSAGGAAPASVDDSAADLDVSVLSVSQLGSSQGPNADGEKEGGSPLSCFFKPILAGIEGADPLMQQGCSLALAHVIYNCGAKAEPHVEKLSKRIVSVLDKAQFAGRAPLLIAVANMIEVCPSAVTGLLRLFLPRIAAAGGSQDFNTRKAAMETIETICLKVDGQSLVECKADMLACVEKCRYDKMKPVREAAVLALKQLQEAGLGADSEPQEAKEAGGAQEGEEGTAEGADAGISAADIALPPQETPRARPASSRNAPATASRSALGASQNGGGAGGQAANGEVVTQLLRHFDAMTKQQVQLIEMVQQMGDSMRDRLETVEQKVFAIELRMQAQEHRQSLPGMPPTPSRAVGTPGRGLAPTAEIQTPSKGVATPSRVPLAQKQ